MQERTKKRKRQDELATTLMRMLLFLYAYEVRGVWWVHDLRVEVGRRRIKAAGFNSQTSDGSRIYLDSTLQQKPMFAGRMLMHELLHLLLSFDDEYDETMVRRMERMLWQKLTYQQKLLFVKKLPSWRRVVKSPE
jgi:hypothetical protein